MMQLTHLLFIRWIFFPLHFPKNVSNFNVCLVWLSLTCMHAHTHTLSHLHTLTHTLSRAHVLSLTHTPIQPSLTYTLTQLIYSLTHILSHTHSHTDDSHIDTLTHILSLTHNSHIHTHSYTNILSLTHSHTFSHTRTHTTLLMRRVYKEWDSNNFPPQLVLNNLVFEVMRSQRLGFPHKMFLTSTQNA